METTITITDVAAFSGVVFGLIGTILSILIYLRDKPKVKVKLSWDMQSIGDPRYEGKDYWGIVTITNTGRRPVYISHTHLVLPEEFDEKILLLSEGIRGEKLGEGDPPKTVMIDQDSLKKYANVWNKIYAVVIDSTGKEYESDIPEKKPIWAEKDNVN